jgi:hypothetical protein
MLHHTTEKYSQASKAKDNLFIPAAFPTVKERRHYTRIILAPSRSLPPPPLCKGPPPPTALPRRSNFKTKWRENKPAVATVTNGAL